MGHENLLIDALELLGSGGLLGLAFLFILSPFKRKTTSFPIASIEAKPTILKATEVKALPPPLPSEFQSTIDEITRNAQLASKHAHGEDAFIGAETLDRYLPDALKAFEAVPQEDWDKPLLNHGKTPKESLGEQLDLLAQRNALAARDASMQRAEGISQNEKFLKERFSQMQNQIEID